MRRWWRGWGCWLSWGRALLKARRRVVSCRVRTAAKEGDRVKKRRSAFAKERERSGKKESSTHIISSLPLIPSLPAVPPTHSSRRSSRTSHRSTQHRRADHHTRISPFHSIRSRHPMTAEHPRCCWNRNSERRRRSRRRMTSSCSWSTESKVAQRAERGPLPYRSRRNRSSSHAPFSIRPVPIVHPVVVVGRSRRLSSHSVREDVVVNVCVLREPTSLETMLVGGGSGRGSC